MSRLASLLPALVFLAAGCTLLRAAHAPGPLAAPERLPTAAEIADAHARDTAEAAAAQAAEELAAQAAEDEASGYDDGTGASDDDELAGVPSADEGESHDVAVPPGTPEIRYTADLPDAELQRMWKDSPESLGSISIGFTDEGRLVNGERFPDGDGWVVVDPEKSYATRETVEAVITAVKVVREQFPDAPPLRVNQISAREGGWLRPHKSHQNGRDVDLAFYYPSAEPVRARERERYIDKQKTWALLKALVTRTDVQMVLLDKRVQKVLYDAALKSGEDKGWLDSLFNGPTPLVQHARRHRDHLHVRFFAPRAQELGRRVAPLLAMRPEQNVRMHRVRRGDTLGGIAARYGSSVALLRKRNGLKSNFLRLSQVLMVPLMGPCTKCPVPPPVVVPERRLPPPPPVAAEPAPSVSLGGGAADQSAGAQ
ncbi:MAG TPA: penicillin-insensitive murein endopeptidase [Myxococcaceae bacterium]|nr:penicillin-insensitive murein endopeptidase [Myxococcaceae bacterium]